MRDKKNPVAPRNANVFLMIRFRKAQEYEQISETLKNALKQYGLELIRADCKKLRDELWANVRECMDSSGYGIAVFEHITESHLSPNVSLELGYMLAQNKRCLLLKERSVPSLQADLDGHLYREFDSKNISKTVDWEVRRWLQELGIAKRIDEKLLIFVSSGGTCRDPMAKAITQELLEANPPGYRLRVEAAAHTYGTALKVSYAAREAIKRICGRDLLAGYPVSQLTQARIDEADLILLMSESVTNPKIPLPFEKTFVLKPFFGLEGEIRDPFPDGRDKETLDRYFAVAEELKATLTANLSQLIDYLRPVNCPDPATRQRVCQ